MKDCRKSKGIPYTIWFANYCLIDKVGISDTNQLTKSYNSNLTPGESFLITFINKAINECDINE